MGDVLRRVARIAAAGTMALAVTALALPAAKAEPAAPGTAPAVAGSASTAGAAPTQAEHPAASDRDERRGRSALLKAMRPAAVAGQAGGAVIPTDSKDRVRLAFASAGTARVVLPALNSRPAAVAGAFVNVTATAPAGAVAVTVEADAPGRAAPAVHAPASLAEGQGATAVTLVRGGPDLRVTVSGPTEVSLQVVAWVEDEARTDVPAGGVGVAANPETVYSTAVGGQESAALIDALTGSDGVPVYLTGVGGIPAQGAQLAIVHAEFTTVASAEASIQALDARGQWRTVSRASRDRRSQLLMLDVNEVGLTRLRSSGAVTARLTSLGWVSSGQATVEPEEVGAFVPIAGQSIALESTEGEVELWRTADVAGLPESGAPVTAILLGQGQGTGTIRLDGGRAGEWSTLRVNGTASGVAFVSDAHAGLKVRSQGDLDVLVQPVGYLRTRGTPDSPQPGSQASRAQGRSEVSLRVASTAGADEDQARTGQFTLRGSARSAAGIGEVRVTVSGQAGQAYARMDAATGRWSIDLRLPAGRSTVRVEAVDLRGRTAATERAMAIAAPERGRAQVAPDLVVLDRALRGRIAQIAPGFITVRGTEPPALVPGGVLTSPPFARAPDGLLRKVDGMRQVRPGLWKVWTTQAGLADAVVQGTLGQREVSPRFLQGNPLVATWNVAVPVELSTEDLDLEADVDGREVRVEGSLRARLLVEGRSTFAIGISLRTKWGFVPIGADVTYFEYTFANAVRVVSDRIAIGVSDGAVVGFDRPITRPLRFSIPVAAGVSITGGFTPRYQLLLNGTFALTGEASVRTNLRFVYEAAAGGWQEVVEDWLTAPAVSADVTFDGNSLVGLGGAVDVGINDIAGVELELMLGIIGVKGQATLRVRSGLETQPDVAGLNCAAADRDLEVYTTFDMQLSASLGATQWPLVRLEPWKEAWYTC